MNHSARLNRDDKMKEVSQRIHDLRCRFVGIVPEISIDRARIVTNIHSKNFGMPAVLRRARALEAILDNIGIYIGDDELIVGGLAEKPRSVPLFPEYDVDFILDELDTFDTRIADRFLISQQNKATLREILPKWHGNTICDQALRIMPESGTSAAKDMVFILTALHSGVAHMIVDYAAAIDCGLLQIINEAERLREAAPRCDPHFARKRDYYDAVRVVCRAAIDFSGRFAELAESQAARQRNQTRKSELLTIAANCRKVPAHPAETFWEALQSFWFIQIVLHLESNGHSVSPGRFDQYMFPYYQWEAQSGAGREFAEELIHCLWIKFSEMNKVRDKVSSVAFGGYPMFQNLMVGGQTAGGKSAVNELSHLCLEATAKVGLIQPSLSVRWYFGCPEEFLAHAVEVASYGTGMPAFFNDEVLVPNMLQAGFSLEEARNYAVVGCTEETVPGISEPWLTGGFLNLLKILELTIFDGYDLVREKQNRLRTGKPESFGTFGQFKQAYFEQIAYYLGQQVACDNVLDELHGTLTPTPFESALIHDCLERGKTSLEGGARYNSTTINAVGIANVADSLAAIKQLIYEQQTLTWKDLKQALQGNFEGQDILRQELLNRVPKYGNDVDYVDDLGEEVHDFLYHEMKKHTNPRGGPYRNALYSVACHVLFADKVVATPDGRKRGMVLADGGVSCSQGRDLHGPTALLKSVTKLDPYKAVGSTLLNLKLHPNLFRDPAGYRKIASLIKTYFLMKGQHVQFNVIDAQTLRDAQKHPDRYTSLVVRVAGFSVLFTTIDPLLQEDIILRTEIKSG